ncbi:1285_t:CDS:2 [Cetraspora pellucida]|uniref:1285_t:CDS:1 n=1 Tax=Cetraspora pellucida TaxID=1433469 RepID=A0A9N8W2S1_9GLOM|nr:1285_t:CDS:2 [Cetraspora pellucida]
MTQGRSCILLCDKLRKYWLPPADEDYKDYDPPREPAFVILNFDTSIYSNIHVSCSYLYPTGVLDISCSNQIVNESDSSINSIHYYYYDPGLNFTDGSVLNLPYGVYFQISANNSSPNDTLPIALTFPSVQIMDPDLLTNNNKHADSKLSELVSEESNAYVLSPYQRQIIWSDRVKYSDLGTSSKKGVISVAKKSAKHLFNYFGVTTRIQTVSPLNPQAINPLQFTSTFEIYNQSSTLITYKETE